MLKVRCNYCSKDILFEYDDETIKNGDIIGKCNRCGSFCTYNTKTKQFTKTERSDKLNTTK